MILGVVDKGRRTMYWLIRYLANYSWTRPALRLVLMDVYVRSIL